MLDGAWSTRSSAGESPDASMRGLGNLLPTYPVLCGDGMVCPSGGRSGSCSQRGGEL
jgi:hypothetical protein